MTFTDSVVPNVGESWEGRHVGYFRTEDGWRDFAAVYDEGMQRLPHAEEVRDVETSFGTVRAYRFGKDPRTPLLLLPGKVSSTPLWSANLPSLIAERSVWSLDLLGEPGLSVQRERITSAENRARWLAETIEALGIDEVHLLGVSIGGWSAINLAIRHPSRLASVTFLDPPMVFASVGPKMVLVSMGSVIPFMPESWRNKLLGMISGGEEAPEDLPEGRLVAGGMKDFASALPVPSRPTEDELRGIDIPVLGIFAGRSIVQNPKKAAAAATRLLADAEIEIWPEASHAINGEFPTEIAERVHRFLNLRDP